MEYSYIAQADLELVILLLKSPQAGRCHSWLVRYIRGIFSMTFVSISCRPHLSYAYRPELLVTTWEVC